MLFTEFDCDELRKRLLIIMKREPNSNLQWSKIIGIDKGVFYNFIHSKTGLQAKNFFIMEKFLDLKEKDLGL